MKKLLCLFLTLVLVLASAAAFAEAQPEAALFTPGTYTAEAQGIRRVYQDTERGTAGDV